MKMFRKYLSLLAVLFLGFCFPSLSHAENLRSDSYYLQFGNFNITSGKKTGDSYVLTDTVGATAIGPYGSYGTSNYFIGSGFQYIYQIDQFQFQISKLNIQLGELLYGAFGTDFHTLNITTNGASGYQVYAFETRPLRAVSGTEEIANTLCNSSCSTSAAGVWTDATQAGFGYSMSGDDVPPDFVNSNYFRPFANNEIGEAMQIVMSSNSVALDRTATVTYQAAPAGSQAAKTYETSIVFVAVPGY
jgi:hypothetical protein